MKKQAEGLSRNPVSHVDSAIPRELIPEEWREFVEEMLVVGLAVEDIGEALVAKGGPQISEGAILAHFRTHPEIQRKRVEHTVQGVADMRQALGNPQADHTLVDLANSALMIGYMGLTKSRSNSITLKDAEVIRLSRENLKLRQRYMRLKECGQARENKLIQKRLRFEDVKHEKACLELKQLRVSLRALLQEGRLEPGTVDKIKEIYGIVRQPFVEDLADAQTRRA